MMKTSAASSPDMRRLTHFNLAPTTNQVGGDYVLLRIVRAGFMAEDGVETLPVLDLTIAFLARCMEVKQPVALGNVTQDQFAWSLPTIRSTSDLRKALQRRYSSSAAAGSLQSLECSITTFAMKGLAPGRC